MKLVTPRHPLSAVGRWHQDREGKWPTISAKWRGSPVKSAWALPKKEMPRSDLHRASDSHDGTSRGHGLVNEVNRPSRPCPPWTSLDPSPGTSARRISSSAMRECLESKVEGRRPEAQGLESCLRLLPRRVFTNLRIPSTETEPTGLRVESDGDVMGVLLSLDRPWQLTGH